MTTEVQEQLRALAAELLARRDAILESWRASGQAAPDRNIGASLSTAQFHDHIPSVLDCLAATIRGGHSHSGDEAAAVCEHGVQRWQQGYQLREVVREWGTLQMCVADELENYAASHPSLDPSVMPVARRAWNQLCAAGLTESATEFWRLQQAESAGHVMDLERALTTLRDLERSRAEAWRTAAHDLRGSVTVVKGATTLLDSDAPLVERVEVVDMLSKSVSSLHEMLEDLLRLARLDAGHEQREITEFDAGVLMRDFCRASRAAVTDRGLTLETHGPDTLPVQGDKSKVTRILQNLMLNAVKYTQKGGLTITWGADALRETDRWTFSVQDTGPGIDEAVSAPLAQELRNATDVANEVRAVPGRDMAAAITLPSASEAKPASQQAGEGVGLTIVKRLCDLLDASLELATEAGRGTTFRVTLPRAY